ncbi:MAG: hypothetical protein E3J45_06055 [Candidatus Zixiibacteriota bacterium]|nr:MAG: hypothetical protein E3J45_06055 [candidate division Zixibacteria bacterium]
MKNRIFSRSPTRFPLFCFLFFAFLFILGSPARTFAYEKYVKSGTLKVSEGRMKLFSVTTPDNITGDLLVETWKGKQVEVQFELVAKAKSEKEAKRFTEVVDITLDHEGGEVSLRVKSPSRAPWRGGDRSVRLTLEVHLPAGMKIESRTAYFDLDLEGPFGEVTVDNDYGSVILRRARGKTDIRTSYDKIVLEKIEGELHAESSYGSISVTGVDAKGEEIVLESSYGSIAIENVKGKVAASTSYGKIKAVDVDAGDSPLSFETSYGKIELENVKGQLSAETSYQKIIASNVTLTGGSNRLETVYSKISVDFAEIRDSHLSISNKYSDIEVTLPKNTSTRMVATVDSGGSIHASNFPITPTLLDRTRLEGIAGDGKSTIEMNIDGIGTIEVVGK